MAYIVLERTDTDVSTSILLFFLQLLLAESNRFYLPCHVVEIDGYGVLILELYALHANLVHLFNTFG